MQQDTSCDNEATGACNTTTQKFSSKMTQKKGFFLWCSFFTQATIAQRQF